jgi:hypothetical protein
VHFFLQREDQGDERCPDDCQRRIPATRQETEAKGGDPGDRARRVRALFEVGPVQVADGQDRRRAGD